MKLKQQQQRFQCNTRIDNIASTNEICYTRFSLFKNVVVVATRQVDCLDWHGAQHKYLNLECPRATTRQEHRSSYTTSIYLLLLFFIYLFILRFYQNRTWAVDSWNVIYVRALCSINNHHECDVLYNITTSATDV